MISWGTGVEVLTVTVNRIEALIALRDNIKRLLDQGGWLEPTRVRLLAAEASIDVTITEERAEAERKRQHVQDTLRQSQ